MTTKCSKEELAEWLNHPVTVLVRARIDGYIKQEMMEWANGEYYVADPHSAAIQNATALGRVWAYKTVYNLDVDDVNTGDEIDEAPRTES